MRRRSCCDAPRHAFTNLALKYQFATCISAACRDTFLRTAHLWQSSGGGTDQIYRGCARAKLIRLSYPFVSRGRLHALCIYTRRDAASTTQKMKRSVRATQNTEAQDTTTQEATERCTKRAAKRKRPLDLRSRKPSKSAFLKFPLRADRKNQLFKIFSPAQILKSAL